MNTQVETSTSVIDVVKKVFSIVFVVAGVAAFYYFSEIRLLYRVIGLLIVLVSVVGLMLTTDTGEVLWSFVLESKQ